MSRETLTGRPVAALFSGSVLLADGSTGTALEALAPGSSDRAALLPLERPELVESLHAAYFAAGADLVETATFTASAKGLARFAGIPGPAGAATANELAYRVNLAAAAAARRASAAAERADGRPRFVAGSIGPGDEAPSLGASTWAELRSSYLPQARGLVDGGADLALVETVQDPLQAKAALAALASPEGGRGLPFIVSATVDSRGRLLAGTSIEAFVAIVAPFRPLAIGLNCSGGPAELGGSLAELAAVSPFPISFMPNAGLPRSSGGATVWPVGPAEFSVLVAALARRHGAALVGGCCGTGPEHIRALSAELGSGGGRPRPAPRPKRRPALASLYESRPIGPGLFAIGERANAAGSASFSAALAREDFDGMAFIALAQEGSGASALDLHLAKAGRNEAADLAAIVTALAPRAKAALCLDSREPDALEGALRLCGGRPLVNSASLENPATARRVFALAREYGAAVVCIAVDASGPAKSAEDKVRVCRALYELAVGECGLQPDALLFDPLTFAAAAGTPGDVRETLRAIALVKEACPGSLTLLGVGNVSYGLPRALRPLVTSAFLGMARAAGLDAAIVDTAGIPDAAALDGTLRGAAEALLLGTARELSDPLSVLLAAAGLVSVPVPQEEASGIAPAPAAALERAVLRGDSAAALRAARALASRTEGAKAVAAAMAESGRLWAEGSLPLPLVLRSAEAARGALREIESASAGAGTAKGRIVMATVEGDLHDIGKNIAAAIIACSGYEIVDLGTDVAASRIAEAARAEGAAAVGLSGLLTRSLDRMRETCAALESDGSAALVLCGGAAADPAFVAASLEPEHPGLVVACSDAFAAVRELDARANSAPDGALLRPVARGDPEGAPGGAARPRKAASPIAPARPRRIDPAALGEPGLESFGLDALMARLDRPTLFGPRWGYPREAFGQAEAELSALEARLRAAGFPGARATVGAFSCRLVGDSLLEIDGPSGGAGARFTFPIEVSPPHRSVASYFAADEDLAGLFAACVDPLLSREAEDCRARGSFETYWRLHGLGSALAEAAAELAHERVSARLRAAGSGCDGRRYSFGFPACPGVEQQGPLLSLLGADRIGLSLTSGFQLSPEHSVTALVVARPDAEYFTI